MSPRTRWSGPWSGFSGAAALREKPVTMCPAARAWGERMQDIREGCAAAIEALERDGDLAPGWTTEAATDLLWAMLSVETWRRLNEGCGWSAEDYVSRMQAAARGAFVVRP